MSVNICSRVFLVLFLMGLSFGLLGQRTTVRDGDWEDVSTWGNNPPLPLHTNLGAGKKNITVSHYVTAHDDLTFAASNKQASFTVNDTLIVYGNVVFNMDAVAFVIQSGTVIIFGDLTVQGKLEIRSAGTLVVSRNFYMDGQGNNNNTNSLSYKGEGTVYAGNYNENAEKIISDQGTEPERQQTLEDLFTDVDTNPALQDIIDIINGYDEELLPITLGDFHHIQEGRSITLKWMTHTEINFEHFEIQRAGSDGVFGTLATVAGNGNTKNTNYYSWADENPLTGLNYYRLVSNDFDGYRELFDPIAVMYVPQHLQVKLYPNPATAGNRIRVSASGEAGHLNIHRLDGTEVLSEDFDTEEIHLPGWLSPGIYLLKININGLVKEQKIIIR